MTIEEPTIRFIPKGFIKKGLEYRLDEAAAQFFKIVMSMVDGSLPELIRVPNSHPPHSPFSPRIISFPPSFSAPSSLPILCIALFLLFLFLFLLFLLCLLLLCLLLRPLHFLFLSSSSPRSLLFLHSFFSYRFRSPLLPLIFHSISSSSHSPLNLLFLFLFTHPLSILLSFPREEKEGEASARK